MSVKNATLFKTVFRRERRDWNPPGIDCEALKRFWRTLRDPAVQSALGDVLWVARELTVQAATANYRSAVDAGLEEFTDGE